MFVSFLFHFSLWFIQHYLIICLSALSFRTKDEANTVGPAASSLAVWAVPAGGRGKIGQPREKPGTGGPGWPWRPGVGVRERKARRPATTFQDMTGCTFAELL